jgi:hypothetical protein
MLVDQIAVFAATGIAFLLTLVWLAVHAAGGYRYLKADKDPPASSGALFAWGLAFGGGFLGPCVILVSFVALGLGLRELGRVRSGASSPASRLPAQLAVGTSAIIVVMAALMVALILGGQALA